MGLLKTCLKLFSCKSRCNFNDSVMDYDFNRATMDDFQLKYKDIEKIHRILSKRKRRETMEGVVRFKRRDTPRPLTNINEMSIV